MESVTAQAPGRVELLGNHTDYNDGVVLSAAIDRGVRITGAKLEDRQARLSSEALRQQTQVDLDHLQPLEGDEAWANYPLGVAWVLGESGYRVGGFTAAIESTLPFGAGLSSSAALEVATATFLTRLFGWEIDPLQLAKLCKRAENEFVGVNCGLLDQVSSMFGRANHAVFIDCRDETVRTVPFPPGVSLLISHSGVKHALVGGEYNERREQCFDAARRMGVRALRDVTTAQLEAAQESLPPLSYQRARHITGEIERVWQGVKLLENEEVEAFGQLMFESHESSRVWFENSTPELDALVAIAKTEEGVLGSRLTGGGFGGASVSLVRTENASAIAEAVTRRYAAETGHHANTYLCAIADGALLA